MIYKKFRKYSLMKFTVLLIFSSCLPQVFTGRILFMLPLSSKSMANIFEPLAKALSERNHHLTVISPVKFKIPESNKNVTQMIPVTLEEFSRNTSDVYKIRQQNNLFQYPMSFQFKYCNQLYDDPEFMKITEEKFDLIVVNIEQQDCFAGIFYKIGSPIIFIATMPLPSSMTEIIGTYQPSSFIPIMILGDISAQLSFTQRTKNFLYNAYFSVLMDYWTRPPLEKIYRDKLGQQDLPSIREIYKKQTSMMFINSHFALTNPRPYLPNIQEIGGIHCKPAEELSKEMKEFADGSKHGFIIFSQGSIARAQYMPESVRLAFLKTFAKLKENVIWKWDKDEGMPDAPKNVKIVKWIDQQNLLAHPKIKLFITHGGLLSTQEAVYHGVPVLGLSIFFDQDANMRQAEILGFGVKGEILDLTEPKLTSLVRRVLDDPRYTEKAKELSMIFRDQAQSPLDRAVYWTEYVLRHNGAYHLRSAGQDLNLLQYHSVDVVALLIGITVTFLLLTYFSLKYVVSVSLKLFSPAKDAPRKLGINKLQKRFNTNKTKKL